MSKAPSSPELLPVHFDNVRDNQIGGETDGWSEELAADTGYIHPANLDTEQAKAIEKFNTPKSIGKIVCGDCAQVMPCPHGDGQRTFGH